MRFLDIYANKIQVVIIALFHQFTALLIEVEGEYVILVALEHMTGGQDHLSVSKWRLVWIRIRVAHRIVSATKNRETKSEEVIGSLGQELGRNGGGSPDILFPTKFMIDMCRGSAPIDYRL